MNERAEQARVVDEEIETLRTALFDHSLAGIRRTGEVYPLGAFMLIGAMIDMLAGLRYAPSSDRDGKQGTRYADFVHEFFPPVYGRLQLGSRLWRGLRCRPLHNFSTDDVALADGQSAGLHLQHETSGRVLLHWPEFLDDYGIALTSYWAALDRDPAVRRNALIRCLRFSPMMVTEVAFIPPPFSMQSFSVPTIAGASAWGGR